MTTKTTTCPNCGGPNELTTGERDEHGNITRKAIVRVTHRPACPQWQQRARQHGAHPDITELVHEDDQVKITETAQA
jgi:hypothetical protein